MASTPSGPSRDANAPSSAPPAVSAAGLSLSIPKRMGDLMVEIGVLSQGMLDQALEAQRKTGGKLGSLLVTMGFLPEEKLLEFLAQQVGIRYLKIAELGAIPPEVIAKVPEKIAREHTLVPIGLEQGKEGATLTIAVSDPLNVLVVDDLKMMTGLQVVSVLASEREILESLTKNYKQETAQEALDHILSATGATAAEAKGVEHVEPDEEGKSGGEDIISLERSGEGTPVIQMANLLIHSAIKARASDIHIEPFPREIKVRFRIDGVLNEVPAPPKRFQNALASRIKIMANLDIAEKRVPQDGRIKIKVNGKEYALRVSILPVVHGEKVVMRINDASALQVDLNKLGFEPEARAVFDKCIRAPYGINLITGPTGSGKSTTLYSALSMLNEPGVNISTIEDPVEYQLVGINQVQVNAEIGLTFAAGLRSFLRQDPDVIMVGEIRDLETISIAINAALTGHLVFSTLHTNDAPGAITRMGMMGIEPFLMSSSLLMVVAQRLTRGICKQCRENYEVDADWLVKLGVAKHQLQVSGDGKVALARGKGCEDCAGTGYRGRVGLYEVLEVTDPVRQLIMDRAPISAIKEQARKQGMLNLRACAIRKLLGGMTTVEEMIRVTASE
ncbi:MAG: Flp pilus assembly complex ATPase component TadA [Elusimicrobia bacterium]|nr:Flp pilus assembly complex ATPase component TadA [Elusimicrobiota bacterium]